MARKKLDLSKTVDLEKLISSYAENKEKLDAFKKVCDDENKLIKTTMTQDASLLVDEKKWSKIVGSTVATISTKVSKTMNEEKLLEVVKELDIPGVIKTKEYVDMSALEAAMYGSELSTKDLNKINSCVEIKETLELRLTKAKGDK